MSSYVPPDLRRRPPPLMMANDPAARGKLTLDTMSSPPRTPPGQVHGYSQSPTSFFTPSSASYSAVPHEGSPYYVSPASSSSGFWGDNRALRRLSFPTGARPFDMPQHPGTYPPPFRPPPPNYPEGAVYATAAQPPQDPDLDWRRRTWHPSSPSFLRPASGLQTDQPPRLPGIESFDRVQQRPSTPPRREPTPMQVDQAPTSVPAFDPAPPPVSRGHRRGNLSVDTTLQRTLTRLDLGNPQPPTSSEPTQKSWDARPLQPAPAIPSHVQPLTAAERRHSYVPPEYLARVSIPHTLLFVC